jgi:hypothetical protein
MNMYLKHSEKVPRLQLSLLSMNLILPLTHQPIPLLVNAYTAYRFEPPHTQPIRHVCQLPLSLPTEPFHVHTSLEAASTLFQAVDHADTLKRLSLQYAKPTPSRRLQPQDRARIQIPQRVKMNPTQRQTTLWTFCSPAALPHCQYRPSPSR